MSAPTFDHVVYVAPDLDRAVEDLERRTGVRAAYGGRHAGLGTHNALLALGEREYLEVLAPLSQSGEATAGWLSDLEEPRLFMWAVSTSDVGALADRAHAATTPVV